MVKNFFEHSRFVVVGSNEEDRHLSTFYFILTKMWMEMRNWQKSDLPGQVLGGIEDSSESHKRNCSSPVV